MGIIVAESIVVAVAGDLHIMGRLLLRCSLVSEIARHEGWKQCKKAINKFYVKISKDIVLELSHNPIFTHSLTTY